MRVLEKNLKTIKVYTAADEVEAQFIQGLLANAEIFCIRTADVLSSVYPFIPLRDFSTRKESVSGKTINPPEEENVFNRYGNVLEHSLSLTGFTADGLARVRVLIPIDQKELAIQVIPKSKKGV